jgi:AraC-like DNA-binding protein
MSRNSQTKVGPTEDAMVLGEFPLSAGSWLPWHEHDYHQLAWVSHGVLTVRAGDEHWVLPTTRALLIPAGISHRTGATRSTVLRGVYLDPRRTPVRWRRPVMVSVGPLLRELLDYLGGDISSAARKSAQQLVHHLLTPLRAEPIRFVLPTDQRARSVARGLLADPADQRTVAEHAAAASTSGRTLARLFLEQTTLSFGQWRTQIRLHLALTLLADGAPVAAVARRVGYANPSAFLAAFHRGTGHTPTAYLRG